uniref:Leishmanolysin-like peptidase n=1 Tax=Heligmosomoides polygyrus TaxID=6339 RepID=A0A183FQU1_HELPZ
LFVSVRSKNCIANSLAYATHCALDEKTGRPIAGHVNICPDSFNHMMANELSQWESTIKHELIHVFVFSPSLFKKFPGAKQKW